MNVTLIGMAGAGKSYIGKQLAERSGLLFYDNDEALLQAYGRPIQESLEVLGEEAFLDGEARVLEHGTRGRDGLVISPGGSVIYRDAVMHHLKDISSIVYLQVPFETVEARLRNLPPRAIIGLGRKSLRELYDERHPLYAQSADLVVETGKLSADQIVEAITDYLGVDRNNGAATV